MLRKLSLVLVAALIFGVLGSVSVVSAQGPAQGFALVAEIARVLIAETTKATKMTEAELLREVLSGKSLAAVIKEKGADVNAVKAAAKTTLTNDINKAVIDGKLTKEQADRMIANLDRSLDRALNQTRPRLAAVARAQVNVAQVALREVATALKLSQQDLLRELTGGKTLAEVIKSKNGNVDAIKAKVKETLTTNINNAVTEGTLTKEQADRLLAQLDQSITRIFDQPLRGRNAGGNAGAQVQAPLVRAASITALIAETARQSNITQRELLQELRSGKTLTQIATDHKADPAKIVEAAKTTVTTRINQLVSRNRLTQQQADELIKNLGDNLNSLMSATNLLQPGGQRRGGRR